MKIIQIFRNFIENRKDSFINSLLIVTNVHLYVAFYNFYYNGIFQYNNIYISLLFSIIHSVITENYILCKEQILVFGLCFYLHIMHKVNYKYRISERLTTKLISNRCL